jgi:hypothetical protein
VHANVSDMFGGSLVSPPESAPPPCVQRECSGARAQGWNGGGGHAGTAPLMERTWVWKWGAGIFA